MNALDAHSAHDRLALMICLALAFHASVILGVGFAQEPRHYAPPKLEITLAQHHTDKAPTEADFLAQNNQEGSGTLEEARQLTTTQQPDFQDPVIRDISPQQQLAASRESSSQRLVSSTQRSQHQTSSDAPQPQQKNQQASEVTILQRSMEIASLEAQLDIQRQAYAKRPRIRRLTSVATKRAEDAQYLFNWRARVETIGNRNYPDEARQKGIYGELRMMVALLPNGEVHEVKVLKSSGSRLLDQAAIRIVHLAAPFDAFPKEMSKKVDVLEIIRTWRFHENLLTSSS